jgi:hypothetical protein
MRWLIQTLLLSWMLSSERSARRVSIRPEPKSKAPAALIVRAPIHVPDVSPGKGEKHP